MAASPAMNPENTYAPNSTRWAGMPETLAARMLIPTAYSHLP